MRFFFSLWQLQWSFQKNGKCDKDIQFSIENEQFLFALLHQFPFVCLLFCFLLFFFNLQMPNIRRLSARYLFRKLLLNRVSSCNIVPVFRVSGFFFGSNILFEIHIFSRKFPSQFERQNGMAQMNCKMKTKWIPLECHNLSKIET